MANHTLQAHIVDLQSWLLARDPCGLLQNNISLRQEGNSLINVQKGVIEGVH